MLLAERVKFVIAMGIGIFLSPYFYTRMLLRRYLRKDVRPRRILVAPIITRVGDMVCSTPVFRELKRAMPDVELAVLASKRNIGIIKNNPRIDTIININDTPFKGYLGRIRFLFYVGESNFDRVICLTNNPFNNLISLFSSAPIRLKMRAEERSAWEYLTDWFNSQTILYENHTFLPSFYLKMLLPLGIKADKVVKEVFVSREGEQRADNFLKTNEVSSSDRLVGISITAGNKIKEWGDENFSKLAEKIHKKYVAKIIFIGAKSDEKRIIEVLRKFPQDDSYLKTTDFPLEELPSLIKRLSLFIAVDTGTIYIAHALGVPLIDIVGPVDPAEQPPSDEKSVQVLPTGNIKPSSFTIKRARKSEEHERALKATSVESVMDAVDLLLNRSR